MHGPVVTEDQPLHGGVPDDPGAVAVDWVGDGVEVLAGQDGSGGHGGTHQQYGSRLRADGRGQLAWIGSPATFTRNASHVSGNPARQPDAVYQSCIDRITDDDFLPGLHGSQQHVENAVKAAGHADALRARVVAAAGDGADVLRRGLAQRAMPLERQIAVGVVVLYRGVSDLA